MYRWVFWTLFAVVAWGVWALLSKLIGDALSPAMSQALSTAGLFPVMIALALWRGPRVVGKPWRGRLASVGAGILTCAGNVAYYRALNSGPNASSVVSLSAVYPLVTVVLAVVLLRERLDRIQASGILLSLVAIYLFNVPRNAGLISTWLLVTLIPIVLWGVSGFLQKVATADLSGHSAAWWFLAAFIPVAGLILMSEPIPPGISARTWGLVALLGLTFAAGNFAILVAFARGGKASVIAPLAALYPLVSIPLAMIVLRERVAAREAIGILFALMAVAALSWESKPKPVNERLSSDSSLPKPS